VNEELVKFKESMPRQLQEKNCEADLDLARVRESEPSKLFAFMYESLGLDAEHSESYSVRRGYELLQDPLKAFQLQRADSDPRTQLSFLEYVRRMSIRTDSTQYRR